MPATTYKVDGEVIILKAGADAREEGLRRARAVRLDVENYYVFLLFTRNLCQLWNILVFIVRSKVDPPQ
jgi:hypothetical protein